MQVADEMVEGRGAGLDRELFVEPGENATFELDGVRLTTRLIEGEFPNYRGLIPASYPNRLVVGRNVKPGRRIQLAVFGINGPLSNPPPNYIWMRYAREDQLRS